MSVNRLSTSVRNDGRMTNTAELTLADFLLARIAEDEASAQAAGSGNWDADRLESGDADHIARHDPARVLAECEAKRRIVVLHSEVDEGGGLHLCHEWLADDTQCGELRALASVYADHPDYRPEWRA